MATVSSRKRRGEERDGGYELLDSTDRDRPIKLRSTRDAPNQAFEGAPEALLEIDSALTPALHRVTPGQDLILLTWLHRADRSVLQTHPRGDPDTPQTGVFATRSPDRPNPIGLHRVTITAIDPPTVLRSRRSRRSTALRFSTSKP
jgi:tRNA (Thr-GGU) A37 N-methylase